MNPVVKYSLARLALFVAVAVVLLVTPVPIDPLLKLMIALLVSLGLSFFVLKRMRSEMADYLAGVVQRRQEQKEKLRAALAGENPASAGENAVSAASMGDGSPSPAGENPSPAGEHKP